MSERKGICVTILEKEFRVMCEERQGSLVREAALYLDKQMKQIQKRGRVVGVERIAVMVALNMAYDLLDHHKRSQEGVPQDLTLFSQRLRALQEKMDKVLAYKPRPLSEKQPAIEEVAI